MDALRNWCQQLRISMLADDPVTRTARIPWLVGCALLFWFSGGAAQDLAARSSATQLAQRLSQSTFSTMTAGAVAAPWRVVGLPKQTMPLTRFDIATDAGVAVVRVMTDGSYGNLAFDAGGVRLTQNTILRWRWRLDQGLSGSDLRRKDGDDVPIKVCALFDMDLSGMSFGEQSRLRFARAMTGEHLPGASLCYVWDRVLPVGTELANVFSARVRYVVASSGAARPGQWVALERELGADFLRAFGHETREIPPLIALVVGADADNTGARSLAFVGDLVLVQPRP